ncbi:glycosyltransferase [Nitrospira sp. M1]
MMDNNKQGIGIAFWLFNYAPQWEAASKEVDILVRHMEGKHRVNLITCNQKTTKKVSIFQNTKYLPLPFSLIFLPFLRTFASQFHVNHIFASGGERLLTPTLCSMNSLITITKDTGSLANVEKNIPYLRQLKYIVVESERHQEVLRQCGIDDKNVKLIYPGVALNPIIPATGPFTILFATSPTSRYDLLSRGIFLMLNAAKHMPDVQFVFVWREKNLPELQEHIHRLQVKNVEVKNGVIEMDQVYQSVHATILPGLEYHSIKPSPHSGIESLAWGKPVLVSAPSSLAPLVAKFQCGLVFEPNVESLKTAIQQLIKNYDDYAVNCHPVIEKNFSKETFVAKYQQLYLDMMDSMS